MNIKHLKSIFPKTVLWKSMYKLSLVKWSLGDQLIKKNCKTHKTECQGALEGHGWFLLFPCFCLSFVPLSPSASLFLSLSLSLSLSLCVFLCLSLLGTAKSLLSLKQLQLPSALHSSAGMWSSLPTAPHSLPPTAQRPFTQGLCSVNVADLKFSERDCLATSGPVSL